jgi:LPXTG-site transpeptidase (sortase) family protein
LIAFIALAFTWIFGGPKIDIEFKTAFLIGAFLFLAFLALVFFSAYSVPPYKQTGGKEFVGPYRYIRHPICAVIVYLLNPALAIIFRSWLYLLACILIYFVWKSIAESEEIATAKKIGKEYGQYRLGTNLFFPDLYSISRPLFFFLMGATVFVVVFVFLNYSSLSFRYIGWREDDSLPVDVNVESVTNVEQDIGNTIEANPLEVNERVGNAVAVNEAVYDKPNSIVIEKIGVNAPLIYAQSTDQKELNRSLNNGVVIYPGSDLPGQNGNLFLTGHSSVYPWNKTIYGRVFAALDKLETGDVVIIYLQQRKSEYRITNKYTAAPKDVRLIHLTDEAKITLMTCWPIGTNLERLIVEGVLTNSH